jgi:hypothetical protein
MQRIFIDIYAMADGATHSAKSIEFDSYQTGRVIPVDCVYHATSGKPRPDLFAEGSCRSDVFGDVGYTWQHLDRDQVDTPELCSNRRRCALSSV